MEKIIADDKRSKIVTRYGSRGLSSANNVDARCLRQGSLSCVDACGFLKQESFGVWIDGGKEGFLRNVGVVDMKGFEWE